MLGWEFPPYISGGLGTYLYNFTKELSKKADKIYFLMPFPSAAKPDFNMEFAGENNNMEIICLDSKSFSPYHASAANRLISTESEKELLPYGLDFLENVKAYTDKAVKTALSLDFDIIHAHDWMTFPAAMEIARLAKKPFIATIHSTEYDRGAFISLNSYIMEIEKAGLHRANKVITVSKRMKNYLVQLYGIPESKISVIYNGIVRKGRIADNDSGKKMVLFVGRLTIQKGCDYFLEAAKLAIGKDPEMSFVVVGQGDMLPQLINQSIRLGISNNVFFTGFEEDVDKYYRAAGLFVMPSVSEPFGLTAVEAISNGIPAIISKTSGTAEVLSHAFKTDFWDTREMANQMLGIVKYPALKQEMRKNSLIETERLNTWNDVAEQTMATYREVLA